MDMWFLLSESDRARKAAIALFIAATFGLAAILSLPVARLLPFPFRAPAVTDEVRLPQRVQPPVVPDWPSGGRLGTVERLRRARPVSAPTVSAPVEATGRPDRPARSEREEPRDDDVPAPVVPDAEPLEADVVHVDKAPRHPPAQQVSVEKDREVEQPDGKVDKGEVGAEPLP